MILAHGRLRQEDHAFGTHLGDRESLPDYGWVWLMEDRVPTGPELPQWKFIVDFHIAHAPGNVSSQLC